MDKIMYLVLLEDYKETYPPEAKELCRWLQDTTDLGEICVTYKYRDLMKTIWITCKESFLQNKYPKLLHFAKLSPTFSEFLEWKPENFGVHKIETVDEPGMEDRIV